MQNYIEYELLVTINNAINTLNELDTSKYKEDPAFLADRIDIDATNVVVRVLDHIIARKADFKPDRPAKSKNGQESLEDATENQRI
jgi:hypothetical protein